jgi:hypothetical protein
MVFVRSNNFYYTLQHSKILYRFSFNFLPLNEYVQICVLLVSFSSLFITISCFRHARILLYNLKYHKVAHELLGYQHQGYHPILILTITFNNEIQYHDSEPYMVNQISLYHQFKSLHAKGKYSVF